MAHEHNSINNNNNNNHGSNTGNHGTGNNYGNNNGNSPLGPNPGSSISYGTYVTHGQNPQQRTLHTPQNSQNHGGFNYAPTFTNTIPSGPLNKVSTNPIPIQSPTPLRPVQQPIVQTVLPPAYQLPKSYPVAVKTIPVQIPVTQVAQPVNVVPQTYSVVAQPITVRVPSVVVPVGHPVYVNGAGHIGRIDLVYGESNIDKTISPVGPGYSYMHGSHGGSPMTYTSVSAAPHLEYRP